MARRKRRWEPIGKWLKSARKDADLTQQELATLTGISVASLSRFESDQAEPSFGDICVIALQLGWPLLHFATGRERKSDDDSSLAAELHFWGLRDVRLGKPVLLGEVRAFEELFADAVARVLDARILEALPALLLRNAFEAQELVAQASAYVSTRRVGWLSAVAEEIAHKLPPESVQPEARRRLRDVSAAAWETKASREPDHIGPLVGKSFRDRVWQNSPPLARRWRIACDTTLEEFAKRAHSVLAGG